MRKLSLLTLLALLVISACRKDENDSTELDISLQQSLEAVSGGRGLAYFLLPDSDDLDAIPQDPKNPLTPAKVELGKQLFHETGLAINPKFPNSEETYSCASCHFASAGFQAGRWQGMGEGGMGFGLNGEGRAKLTIYHPDSIDVQPIRTPAALNTAYQEIMLWNGQFGATGMNEGTEDRWTPGTPKETNEMGYQGLEIQAIAGLKVHRLGGDTSWLLEKGYGPLFSAAFPNMEATESMDLEHIGLAIAAYERTLLANQAPFQRWLKGENSAMNKQEKEGAILFFTSAKCGSCHTGPALNSMAFYAYGMHDLHACPEPVFQAGPQAGANLGRADFTGLAADEYKFKVPQLYNMANSLFLGHGSSFRNIRDVVAYKNKGIPENENVPSEQLAEQFVPLNLTNTEVDAIAAFLRTGLQDPDLDRYVPSSLLSGLCFPNNDAASRVDLDCY